MRKYQCNACGIRSCTAEYQDGSGTPFKCTGGSAFLCKTQWKEIEQGFYEEETKVKEQRWKPKNGEMYWYVWNDGNACWGNFTGTSDERRFKFGNCFKTEEEAKASAEKVKALLLSLHCGVAIDVATKAALAEADGAMKLGRAFIKLFAGNKELQASVQDNTSSRQDKPLPKLTAEVFNRPYCPEWANYAAVDGYGMVLFMVNKPNVRMVAGEAIGWSTVGGIYTHLSPMRFDASDWQNSLIERPAKLPDWCKEGEWVFDATINEYIKVSKGDVTKYSAKVCKYISDGEIRQARLRPYDAEEMESMVGLTVKGVSNSEIITGFKKNKWGNFVVKGACGWYDAKHLLENFTTNGSPCGVLEHLENGEWVK